MFNSTSRLRSLCSLSLMLLMAANLFAQMEGSHTKNAPPPPGARTVVCKGRPIPQLTDVTKKIGIKFEHLSSPDKKYIVESMAGGVIVIDYDRDGWPDIYFTNAPTVDQALKKVIAKGALYHNNHDGTFTDVTDKAGVGTPCFANGGSVGDYNNDGWPDLFITCLGQNVLYRNNGDGTFTDVTKQAKLDNYAGYTTGSAFGDYDGDGFVDLVTTGYVDFRLDDLPGFGKTPTCKYRGIDVQCGPRGLRGAGDHLYHNNGDGTFTDVSKKTGTDDPGGYYGLSAVWVDFDNNGRPDIYVANDSTPNFLYKNEGNGTFSEIGLESGTAVSADGSEQGSMGIAVGDYNHTGRPSLLVTNFADEYNTLYSNQGKYDFRDVSYEAGVALAALPWVKWGIEFIDFDNDGWLDTISVNGQVYPQVDSLSSGARYAQPKNLFFNQRNGTFCDAQDQAGPAIKEPRVSRGLAIADLDNDGNMDVVIEDLDGAPMILHNAGLPPVVVPAATKENPKATKTEVNHWVSFELGGTKSNKLAFNARLKIVAGGMTQTHQIHGGGGYLSQSDLRAHFGLANATKIDSLEIYWPSGIVDTIKDLQVDKFYSVLEGSGIVDHSKIVPAGPVKK